MSSFAAMGPLASFITSCRASVLGRSLAFGNCLPTIWLPARSMTSYSSPLTIKPARSALGAAFPYNKCYTTVDQNPAYRILLDYASDEPGDTPLHPLRLLRQAMHRALYVHNRQRPRSLSTIKHIFKLYTALLGQDSLEPVDMLMIAWLLVLTLDSQLPSPAITISRYIGVFASHYVTKALPPHSEASSHLLSLYSTVGEYEMGARLWDWMVHQDDRYVSTKTYAGAIGLAAAGNPSLRVCEELYKEALIRYSGRLVSLILSPGFMLPPHLHNRKAVSLNPHLSLADFDARIRKGDWRTAYLNLDTAFRLWSSNIDYRFLNRVLKGRPVHEGYQVYFLFCQAGAYVRGKELYLLLDAMARACEDSVDLGLKRDLTKAMLEAILVFVNSKDATFDERHLDCLIRGFLSILPRQGLGSRQKNNKLDIIVSSFLSYLKEWFLSRGSKLGSRIPITVISWGRKLRNKSSFKWALSEIRNRDQNVTTQSLRAEYSPPNRVLYNSLLYAAGEVRSPETVKTAWKSLARRLRSTRFGPRLSDWRHFAAAAKRTDLVPYCNLQLDLFVSKGKIGALKAKKADYVSRARRNYPSDQGMHGENPYTRIAIEAFVQGARAILGDYDSATSKGTNNISLIRSFIWRWPATVPEEWQRRLYDELSSKSGLELSAVSMLYIGGKARKSLGISYRDLRYRSWKTINNLLLQAEAFEYRKKRPIDSHDHKVGPHSIVRCKIRKKDGSARPHHLPWLLEHLDDIEKQSNKQYNEEEWREKILNLRSPNHRYRRSKQTS